VRDAYGNCDSACGCVDDPFSYSCVEGACGAECDSNDDCDCPADGCNVYNHKYPNYFDFPDYSECSLETCSCADCEPETKICDPRCMGECEVYVRLEHDQGNKANYNQYPHNPSGGTYDIWIVVETNGKCDGWRIPIKYWWCQCPNFDPDQEDIEYSVWPPKWNRLCTTNAGNPNTDSLFCAPCEWRTLTLDVRGGDPGGEIMRVKTNVGLAEGTYQIDIAEYHDCYDRKAAVALGCAGHLEDQPTHLECSNKACQEVAGLGADQCSKDSDCYFYKCVDQACVKRAGTQADQCSTNADCVIETHTECSSMTCVEVSGSGTNQCSQDCDCYHLECRNQQCVQVAGDGQDLCSVNSDCVIEYHNECVGFRCESVLGPGLDECFDDFECEVPMV